MVPAAVANQCPIVVQEAVRHGKEQESRFLRQSIQAIQNSTSKADAVESFLLLAQSSNAKVNQRAINATCSTLLLLHTQHQMGKELYDKAISDAAFGEESGGDVFHGLSPEEEKCIALYHSRRLVRYAEKSHSFDPHLSRLVEGGDNSSALKLEHHIGQSFGVSTVSTSCSALLDLMHLDISWGVALRLCQRAQQQLGADVHPPVEMADQLMGLMSGYRTDAIGSRPWRDALQVYDNVLNSGYTTSLTTHTRALDALWRSGDSFHRSHSHLSLSHRNLVWRMIQRIQSNVDVAKLNISGDEGCMYMESLTKAVAATGHWDAVLQILSDMATTSDELSYRLLIPTPETYLFAMASCNAQGHQTHSAGVLKLFESTYNFTHPHSEALLVYLQSLHHVIGLCSTVGGIVERVIELKKSTLSRPCIIACLQLLSSRKVETASSKEKLGLQLFDMYDSTRWPQEPLVRKIELQTIFRCLYLINAEAKSEGAALHCIERVREKIRSIFGSSSTEEKYLDGTAVYDLLTTDDWKHALRIYEAYSSDKDSPIPLYQLKHTLLDALLRSCRKLSVSVNEDVAFLLDEDEQMKQSDSVRQIVELAKRKALDLFPMMDYPQEIMAELFLLGAAHAEGRSEKKTYLAQALQCFSLAPHHCLTTARLNLLSNVSGLTEEHLLGSLCDSHVTARRASLTSLGEKVMAR